MTAPGPLRLVPPDPDLAEFPPRKFACDSRPAPCSLCTMSCPYDVDRDVLNAVKEEEP